MKKLKILQIVRAFGAVSLGDLIAAGREWGDPLVPGDLKLIETMIRDDLLMRGSDGKVRSPEFRKVAKKVESGVVDPDKPDELLHYFVDSKEFSWKEVIKALGVDRKAAKAICEKLAGEGKIEIVRWQPFFKSQFPWYRVVK